MVGAQENIKKEESIVNVKGAFVKLFIASRLNDREIECPLKLRQRAGVLHHPLRELGPF